MLGSSAWAPTDAVQQWTSVVTMSFAAVVLFYEGFIYNAIFLSRVLPATGRSQQVLPLAVIFNGLYLLAVWSLTKAHWSDPGTVPQRWQEFVRRNSLTIPIFAAVPQWQAGKATYCKSCDVARPERAHHCHSCNVCVLRFDHHCLWINNCVGFNNHKYFLLSGIYCCLGLLVILATAFPVIAYCIIQAVWSEESMAGLGEARMLMSERFAVLVSGTLAFCICTLLMAMLFVHLPRAAQNITAPESNYSNMPNPFNRGSMLKNLEQVFGEFGWDWFFPVQPRRRVTDGVVLQHSDDPEWFYLDDDGSGQGLEAEEMWRLRYDEGVPEPVKPPGCGGTLF